MEVCVLGRWCKRGHAEAESMSLILTWAAEILGSGLAFMCFVYKTFPGTGIL